MTEYRRPNPATGALLRHLRLAAACLAMPLAAAAPFALAEGSGLDWPHWRGPNHDGTSDARSLPTEWSEESNLCWQLPLPGLSGATPIVGGGLVYLHVGEEDELALWAVDAATGAVRWKRGLGGGNKVTRKHNLSSPSPVTDGQRVWVMTGTGVLAAFDRDGGELWRRDLQKEYGSFGILWGYASSPLLVDGVLYVQVLHGMNTDEPSYVLAIDGASGETRWRVERPTDALFESPDAYTTPVLLTASGRRELVISGADYVTGHDLASGRELWRVGGLNPGRERNYRIVGTPVAAGDLLYVPSRVSPLLALRIPDSGPPTPAWSLERASDVPSPVTDGEILFVVTDRGVLRRFDAETGKELSEPRRLAGGTYSASPILAGGRLYAVNESGVTTIVTADAKAEAVAENTLPGLTLASPAVSGGKLLLRTAEGLFCIGENTQAAATP